MTCNRRTFVLGGLSAFAASVTVGEGRAQSFPSRPVRIVAPYAPGGGLDAIARILAQRMAELLGQSVVIENRAGAGGQIGMAAVANSAADGHTLLIAGAGELVVQPAFKPGPNSDPLSRFAPITSIAESPTLVVAHPEIVGSSVDTLMASARRRGNLSMASAGNGTSGHLTVEILRSGGFDVLHVPYRGAGPALNDVLAGQVSLAVMGAPPALPHVRSGKLKAIAVAAAGRSKHLPSTPTVRELFGTGDAEFGVFYALLAPRDTPRDILQTLERTALRALREPGVARQIEELGSEVLARPGSELETRLRADVERNTALVKRLGLKLE